MTFRKISLAFLILTVSTTCAFAKKEPKYEAVHPLTPEQSAYLTPKQFELLHYLMSHAGRPIPHAKLLRTVWGPEYGNELEYLRTYIRQIRMKIEDNPAEPKYLLTDSHIGYRFSEVA